MVAAGPASSDVNGAPAGNIPAAAIAAGTSSTCVIVDNGTVTCWGGNNLGQLGYGDTSPRGDGPGEMGTALPVVDLGAGRTATTIASGGLHTCAILDNATVKCWGPNSAGALGYGDTNNRGDGPNHMGANLPTVDLGPGRTATAITAGYRHTCAILDTGRVKCWGDGSNGRLGYGDTADRGDGPNEMGANLPTVDLGPGRTATAITAAEEHTCAILDNATVKCWGGGSSGRLGSGDTADRGDGPNEMGANLPTVDLGPGRTATAITAGSFYNCALLDSGTVKCWGSGSNGRLGYGDTDNRGDGPNEMGANLPTVDLGPGRTAIAIAAGGSRSCAVLDNATVKCWGQGAFGQLGYGDTNNRGDGPNEMGANLPAVDLVRLVGRSAVAVTLTADRATVVAGSRVTYTVAVRNTGSVPLTSVTVDAAIDACDRRFVSLEPQTTTSYTCKRSTSAGLSSVVNLALVTTSQGVVALSSAVSTRVDPVVNRGDGLIRVGARAFAGNNTYNRTGAGQMTTVSVAKKGKARFTVRAQNDGNATRSLTIRGPGSTRAFTVVYKRGTTNITSRVVAGTYSTGKLAPGATHDITLTIRAKASATAGNAITRAVTITGGSTKDTVKATVNRS
jgi:uncharacterized repeat protein (TIGR01451 family)